METLNGGMIVHALITIAAVGGLCLAGVVALFRAF